MTRQREQQDKCVSHMTPYASLHKVTHWDWVMAALVLAALLVLAVL